MDLVRDLLIAIEGMGSGKAVIPQIDGRSDDEIGYHLKLLLEAGFLKGVESKCHGSGTRVLPISLTWQGHEFLDLSRNDTNWSKAKSWILSRGQELSIDALKTALSLMLREALGT